MNICKSITFIYTKRKLSVKKIKNPIASKITKYLGVSLITEVKDLHTEYYMILKETIGDTSKCKDVLLDQRVNMVKISKLCKSMYSFSVSPIKIRMSFFTEIVKTILKFVWNSKRLKEPKQS